MPTAKQPKKRVRKNPLYVELPDKVNAMLWAILEDEATAEYGSNSSDLVRKMIRDEFKRRKLKLEGE